DGFPALRSATHLWVQNGNGRRGSGDAKGADGPFVDYDHHALRSPHPGTQEERNRKTPPKNPPKEGLTQWKRAEYKDLLNRRTVKNCTGGSNPPLSAIIF